jgi:hypothetical protein
MLAYLPPPELRDGHGGGRLCPGGGHHLLSIDHEGVDVRTGSWSAASRRSCLKYRLLPSPTADDEFAAFFWQLMAEPGMLLPLLTPEHRATFLADGQRAIELVRERAARNGAFAADRVGILGFSAGGHVAAFGRAPPHGRVRAPTSPRRSTPACGRSSPCRRTRRRCSSPSPRTTSSASGSWAIRSGSTRACGARRAASVELHAYASGGHGFGMRRRGLPADGWIDRFYDWLVHQRARRPGGRPA